jgi:hypothetical protein
MASTTAPQTEITFRGGDTRTVNGSPEEVAEQLRQQRGDPIRLMTIDGNVLFVNWSNVLYLEPSWPPAAA